MHGSSFWIPVALVMLLSGLLLLGLALDLRRRKLTVAQYLAYALLRIYCGLMQGVRLPRTDPLPARGPALLISNHTSPADPLLLQNGSKRVISFMMAREYYDIGVLRPFFRISRTILVNRTGRDTGALRAALRAVTEGRVIGVFPEGGIHLDPHTLGQAKPGIALIALRTRVPVIPAFVERCEHTNRLWRGLFHPARARVRFGPPIDLTAYYDQEHDRAVLEEVTGLLMSAIGSLRARAG